MTPIYHITTRAQWQAAQGGQFYEAPSLAIEGFIHCSTASQLPGTAERFFRGQPDLVILCIDAQQVHAPIRYEGREEEARFPHIYGPLDPSAVVAALDLPWNGNRFVFPPLPLAL